MRVAVGQLHSGADTDRNAQQAVAAMRSAAESGAELVVLPEATQHEFGPSGQSLVAVAEPLDGRFVTELSGAAQATDITVVAGMFETRDSVTRVANTIVVVGPNGLVAWYRKVHLYDAFGNMESDSVEPGDPGELVVVPIGALSVGILTCYDLRFPEIARSLAERGATALAVPAAWYAGPHKIDQWNVLVRARAIEETIFVLAAGQPEPTCCGNSVILDPRGVALAQLDGATAGPDALALATIEPTLIDEVRAKVPVLANRRFGVVPLR
jgi:deaminated glutathione amidase